jgi:hypothetical protein
MGDGGGRRSLLGWFARRGLLHEGRVVVDQFQIHTHREYMRWIALFRFRHAQSRGIPQQSDRFSRLLPEKAKARVRASRNDQSGLVLEIFNSSS